MQSQSELTEGATMTTLKTLILSMSQQTSYDHGLTESDIDEGELRGDKSLPVVDALWRWGPLTIDQLQRQTGLSRASVSGLLGRLTRAGWVLPHQPDDESQAADRARSGTEDTARRSPPGRPPRLHALAGSKAAILGIEVEGERMQLVVAGLDMKPWDRGERRKDVPAGESAERAMGELRRLVDETLADLHLDRERIIGAGVSLPAPIDQRAGRVGRTTTLPGWVGLPAKQRIEDCLWGIPAEVDNDANAGALAELEVGAARGRRDVVYVKVATGIGCGLVLDGRLYRGHLGTAGELGHVVMDPGGLICDCGNRGCLGNVAAAGGLFELLRLTHAGRLEQAAASQEERLALVIEWAHLGDRACVRALQEAADKLALALGNLCSLLNPELVVVSGTLSTAGDLLLEPLRSSLSRYTSPHVVKTPDVVVSQCGPSVGVTGALVMVRRARNDRMTRRLSKLLEAEVS
jgi:glucokinase-like ROK family protein